LLALLPGMSFALGLGDIQLTSRLNAPLDAQIEVLGATPEEVAQLRVQMASRDLFSRYGLDYPNYFSGINVALTRSADGRDVIRLTSDAPITEPFATLLIEASSARERIIREYTVLFDPPVFAPTAAAAAVAPVAAPVAGAGDRSGEIARPVETAPPPAPPPAQVAAQRPAPPPAAGNAGGTYTVRSGDTLSRITQQMAVDPAQRDAAMIAIFRANPAAFDDNINLLRSGAVLRLPDAAEVAAVDRGEAAQEVRRQSVAWSNRSTGSASAVASNNARLQLVAPTGTGQAGGVDDGGGARNGAGGGNGGAAGGDAQAQAEAQAQVQAANERATQLEAELAETRRLLQLRDEELARLQAASGQQVAQDQTSPAEQVSETAPVTDVTPAPEPSPGLLGMLRRYWYAPAALLVLALVWVAVRARRRREEELSFESDLQPFVDEPPRSVSRVSASNTLPLYRPADSKEQAIVVEETSTSLRPLPLGAAASVAEDAVTIAAPTTAASAPVVDTTGVLAQGDALAEADFHMAYGLYDQAADLVRQAIDHEPQRRDLKIKLLEIYSIWGNKAQFLQVAHELARSRDQAEPGEWEKIVIMGKQLAPEDPLFAQSTTGMGRSGVDLNLEGAQNQVDLDFKTEPTVSTSKPYAPVDLDLGSALVEALGDGDSSSATPLDFTLDDPSRGDDVAHIADMTQQAPRYTPRADDYHDHDTVRFTSSADTSEQPVLDPRQAVRQRLDERPTSLPPDQTAELALDDLGLDLGRLENTGVELRALDDTGLTQMLDGVDSPTLNAGLGDTSRELLSPAELMPEPISSTAETGTNPLLPMGDDLDFDLGASDASPGATPDIDSTGRFDNTQRFAAPDFLFDDATEHDLESITMSEVGTKLDLARAYMDMGDPDGARSILNEVLQEGSPAQKQEAQRLIDSIPG
jgi:pilus assembly protein FimV